MGSNCNADIPNFSETSDFKTSILNFQEFQFLVYSIETVVGNPIVICIGRQIFGGLSQTI